MPNLQLSAQRRRRRGPILRVCIRCAALRLSHPSSKTHIAEGVQVRLPISPISARYCGSSFAALPFPKKQNKTKVYSSFWPDHWLFFFNVLFHLWWLSLGLVLPSVSAIVTTSATDLIICWWSCLHLILVNVEEKQVWEHWSKLCFATPTNCTRLDRRYPAAHVDAGLTLFIYCTLHLMLLRHRCLNTLLCFHTVSLTACSAVPTVLQISWEWQCFFFFFI